MKPFKKTGLALRLEYQGKLVSEIRAADIKDDFIIGRGRQSNWVLPDADTMASSRHAVLKRKMGALTLCDLGSRNGVFFNGRKIEERKLAAGDRLKIGECEIIVTAEKDAAAAAKPAGPGRGHHRLEALNGENKHEIIVLDKPVFNVGSEPGSQLLIANPLVSRHHAVISRDENGDAWVEDLGSVNGSSVNRTPLRKKRMLQDRDVLSFAFADYRFLHRDVKHTRAYLGAKIAAVLVTLAVGWMAYTAYMMGKQSAPEMIQAAKARAAQEKFAEAREILMDAVHAREFIKYEPERNTTLEQIAVWEGTAIEWERTLGLIKSKQWLEVNRSLVALRCDRMENWNWNETTAIEKKRLAVKMQEYLEIWFRVRAATDGAAYSDDEVRTLQAMREEMLKIIAREKESGDEFFATFIEDAGGEVARLGANLDAWDAMSKALARLANDNADFKQAAYELEAVEKNATGRVRDRAAQYLVPVRLLQGRQEQLAANVRALTTLKMDAIAAQAPPGPSDDACAMDTRLMERRASIENQYANFAAARGQIQYLLQTFDDHGIQPPQTPPLFAQLSDPAAWEPVFACDVLRLKIPNRMRAEPAGVYDRVLGVEFFHSLLRGAEPERMQFTPDITRARGLFETCQNFEDFVAAQPWLKQGEILRLAAWCGDMRLLREKLAAFLFDEDMANPRRSLIGRRAAIYLAPEGRFDRAAQDKFAKDYEGFRAKIAEKDAAYKAATPENQIRIRDEILGLGLPGDPAIRPLWAARQP
ncbi:MAG: FHA domain-containing protein [Kiritimatiellaeota bacterium]|nr:FHA domain-containing protein [Kiritimatiellota bacterium]